jgi:hypothetical protein
MTVFDRDDQRLGPVADVFGAIFRLDVTWRSDVWLGLDGVDSVVRGETVSLNITCDEMNGCCAELDHSAAPLGLAS